MIATGLPAVDERYVANMDAADREWESYKALPGAGASVAEWIDAFAAARERVWLIASDGQRVRVVHEADAEAVSGIAVSGGERPAWAWTCRKGGAWCMGLFEEGRAVMVATSPEPMLGPSLARDDRGVRLCAGCAGCERADPPRGGRPRGGLRCRRGARRPAAVRRRAGGVLRGAVRAPRRRRRGGCTSGWTRCAGSSSGPWTRRRGGQRRRAVALCRYITTACCSPLEKPTLEYFQAGAPMMKPADVGRLAQRWRRASRRWGHPLHSLCSYFAMFPPQVPHVFIRWLTSSCP